MFEVNGKYHNRKGHYTVLSISPPTMQVRFEDGSVNSLRINIQERIWKNILVEQDATKKVPRKTKPISRQKNRFYLQAIRLIDVEDISASAMRERMSYLLDDTRNLQAGDRFIYYAIELGVFFGVATATGTPKKAGKKVPKYVSHKNGKVTVIPLDWDAQVVEIKDGIDISTIELDSQPNFKKLLTQHNMHLTVSEDDFESLVDTLTELSEEEENEDDLNTEEDDDILEDEI